MILNILTKNLLNKKMNQIQRLFFIAIIIQTGMTGLVLTKKDSSLANTQTLFCFEICSECFSNKQSNDLYGNN
jgi:hypothetical protein